MGNSSPLIQREYLQNVSIDNYSSSMLWFMNQDPETLAWYTVGLGPFYKYRRWMEEFRKENSGQINGYSIQIDDYTIKFLEDGQYQTRTILEILIRGVIIPISNGYIFMNTSKINPIIIYVANSDARLSKLHDLRQSITLKKIGGYKGAIFGSMDAEDFNPDDDLQMVKLLQMRIRESGSLVEGEDEE